MNKDILVKWGIPSFAIAIVATVWMVGTYPVKDGKTAVQLFHNHAAKYITNNQRATSIVMEKAITDKDHLNHQFNYYLQENKLLKLYELKGKMPEDARQRMLHDTQNEINKRLKSIDAIEKKLDNIHGLFSHYQVAIDYRQQATQAN
jgi:hypothetical protein